MQELILQAYPEPEAQDKKKKKGAAPAAAAAANTAIDVSRIDIRVGRIVKSEEKRRIRS